jgi:hypothetical protein
MCISGSTQAAQSSGPSAPVYAAKAAGTPQTPRSLIPRLSLSGISSTCTRIPRPGSSTPKANPPPTPTPNTASAASSSARLVGKPTLDAPTPPAALMRSVSQGSSTPRLDRTGLCYRVRPLSPLCARVRVRVRVCVRVHLCVHAHALISKITHRQQQHANSDQGKYDSGRLHSAFCHAQVSAIFRLFRHPTRYTWSVHEVFFFIIIIRKPPSGNTFETLQP